MLTIGLLLAVTCLPGAVLFRLPVADRSKRAALPAEERAYWMIVMSVIVTTTVAFILAAMDAYTLERLAIINTILAIVLVVASGGNLRMGARTPDWTAVFPAALIALGAWMYFAVPASEYVLGGRDPGVYMSEGIQIAQRRSLVTVDRVAADVPAATRDLFFPAYGGTGYYSVRYMGFHLRDPDAGTVSGQFPQGYPIWIAIGYGLDGVTGSRRVISWWAIFGVVGVYFAAKRLIGPTPAAAAAGLLCLHVIQTWYARYPNSEIVTQALIFPALLAHAYAHEDEDRFFGPVAASLVGLALFTRLPVVIAIVPIIAASMLTHVAGHRLRAGFLVTLAAWLAAAGMYYTTQLRPYFSRPVSYVQSLQAIHLVGLAAGAVAVCALLWAIRRPGIAAVTRKWLPPSLIVVVAIGAVYALYVRQPGPHLAPHDAHALRVFADLYVTRIVLGAAVIGYALVVWRSFWRAPALILTLTTLSLFFFYKMRIWPEHFWMSRRFLTEILPGTFIFAAAALFAPVWIERTESRKMGSDPRDIKGVRPLLYVFGILGVIFLGRQYLEASRAIRTHIEYAGVIPEIERLAAGFGDRDLVLVEGRSASDLHTLALPLSYIWARQVLVLYSPRPEKPMFVEFLQWARHEFDNVYFIGGGGTDLLSPGMRVEPIKTERFAVPEYEATPYTEYPRRARMKPFDLTVYRFVDGTTDEGAFRIDVGGPDDLQVVRFHAKERTGTEQTTFRWTRDHSFFSVPNLKASDRELVLRMSGGRPQKAPPARVTVFLGETPIGTASPDAQFRDYTFAIPLELADELARKRGAVEARVESTTWTPREVLGGGDDRMLGVMIDRAEIR
ncbi:MAG: hypothetical protein EHM55_22590 [Acidobacteria bacterium]|nr:MAG: hypothetical protein EHM55_22590 [Acidobacteriota bacterium]